MGRIARTIANILNRVNMDLGGGYYNECDHAQDLGDDTKPLASDDGLVIKTGGAGRFTVAGFFDYDNKIAGEGEKRIYGRDSNGDAINHVYLKNDGTILISNDNVGYTLNPDGSTVETNGSGTKTMATDGTVTINGFVINPDGSAESPISVTAPLVAAGVSLTKAGVEVADGQHDHEAGDLLDSLGGAVTGTTAESNG